MYKVKHYFRLFWWLIPICSTKDMNFNQLQSYLQDYYNVKVLKYDTIKEFIGQTMMINGWKRPNIGIRMRVETCLD